MDSETVVRVGWGAGRFDGFDLPLDTISTKLDELTANHTAYPILHYFYTQRRQYAAVPSVAVLDDTLALVRLGTPRENRPNRATIESANSSVENYLEMVSETFTQSDETPPTPDLDALREAGVPTVSNEEFADSLATVSERRRKLLGLINADERYWPGAGDDR